MIGWSSYQFSGRSSAVGRRGRAGLATWKLAALASLAAWIGAGACLAPDAQQSMAGGSSSAGGGTPGGAGGSGNQGGGGSGQGGGGVGGGTGGSPSGIDVEWVRNFGNASSQSARIVAAEASGGVFVAGLFQNETLTTDSVMLSNAGGTDIFVMKLDPDGNVAWSRGFGGGGEQLVNAMAVDPKDGSVVVVGGFGQTMSTNECGEVKAPSGLPNVFVMKLNPNDGSCAWSKAFGDDLEQAALSVAVDAEQRIIVAGTFMGTLDFGAPAQPLTVEDTPDVTDIAEIFLARLDASGAPLLARSLGDTTLNIAQATLGVAVDSANDILVTGAFEGALKASPETVINMSQPDLFIAKLTGAEATPAWALTSGDMASAQFGRDIVVDASNNAIVSGHFSGPLALDGQPSFTAVDVDVVVAAISPDGAPIWVKRVGGVGAQYAVGLGLDAGGSILLGGMFNGVLDFGEGGTLIGSDVIAGAPFDAYVAKLSPKGDVVWSFQGSGSESQFTLSVARASTGGVFAAGWFQGAAALGGPPISSAGSEDIFVLKLVD